jgi:hypothetical protein
VFSRARIAGVEGPKHSIQRRLLAVVLEALESPRRCAAPLVESARAAPEQLLAVARRHRLTPLISATFGGQLGPALADTFRRDRLVTVARNLILARAAEECLGAFAAADVPAIVLKGLAYEGTLYSLGGARPTADVDLLVPGDSRRAAFEVLDRLGFEPRAAAAGFDDADYHEVAWHRAGIDIDLHLALAPSVRCHIDYDDVWRRVTDITIGATPARALALEHAAVFHALHMAIDHFDVPGLYLFDFARQLGSEAAFAAAEATARAWGCARPFATATALSDAFLPVWKGGHAPRTVPAFAAEVVERFGPIAPLARPRQLLRKIAHFDDPITACRYVAVQARRNARELYERRVRKRSARQRLGLSPKPASKTA